MTDLFNKISEKTSKITTSTYSTSFSFGISILANKFHQPIYNIYGFVRFADEIVDSLHEYNQSYLLQKFEKDCFDAIKQKVSLNPILNSFQKVVNNYNIDLNLIELFIHSMKMDLEKDQLYNEEKYKKYIIGSAEAVGLMCLYVFLEGNTKMYHELKPFAQKLGSAFQKVNFLRDIKNDYQDLNRTYFPNIDIKKFNDNDKEKIEQDIELDFEIAYKGIILLPKEARGGVYLSYIYYLTLLKKIKSIAAENLLQKRIRVPNYIKIILLIKALVKNKINLI